MVGIPREVPANVSDLKPVDDAGFHPFQLAKQQ
jgi:hypothetical protein